VENLFLSVMHKFSKLAIYVVILIVTLTTIAGTIDLCFDFFSELSTSNSHLFYFPLEKLMRMFSLSLLVVVGYELIKSIHLVVSSNEIPVQEITKIAAIAALNKIITLDFDIHDPLKICAIGFMLISIAITFMLFRRSV
jgi:uncharacterized membrane protein (DUF373 family)